MEGFQAFAAAALVKTLAAAIIIGHPSIGGWFTGICLYTSLFLLLDIKSLLEFTRLEVTRTSSHRQSIFWIFCLFIGYLIFRLLPKLHVAIHRKFFHLLSIVMFVPPLVWTYDHAFIGIASLTVLSVMVVTETFRMFYPKNFVSRKISLAFHPVLDTKDLKARFITSHIELLIASTGPVILSLLTQNFFLRQRGILLSGLMTVGLGDSCAAVVGLSVSRPHKIGNTSKSVEGLLAFIISVGGAYWFMGKSAWISAIAAGVTECFVRDHDNLVIPIVFILVSYLTNS